MVSVGVIVWLASELMFFAGLFGIYFTVAVGYALMNEIYGTLPFLMLFQFGYLYMGLMSIVQQFREADVLVKSPQIAGGE